MPQHVSSCYTRKRSVPASIAFCRRRVSFRKSLLWLTKKLVPKRILNALLVLAEKEGYLNASLHTFVLCPRMDQTTSFSYLPAYLERYIDQQANAVSSRGWYCVMLGNLQSQYDPFLYDIFLHNYEHTPWAQPQCTGSCTSTSLWTSANSYNSGCKHKALLLWVGASQTNQMEIEYFLQLSFISIFRWGGRVVAGGIDLDEWFFFFFFRTSIFLPEVVFQFTEVLLKQRCWKLLTISFSINI